MTTKSPHEAQLQALAQGINAVAGMAIALKLGRAEFETLAGRAYDAMTPIAHAITPIDAPLGDVFEP